MYHTVIDSFSGFYYQNSSSVEYNRGLVFNSFSTKKERDSFLTEQNKESKFLYRVPCTAISGRVFASLKKRKEKDLNDIEFCKYRKWLKDNLSN